MTVAVACYIALSAVANANSKTNVAGANDNPETDLPTVRKSRFIPLCPERARKWTEKALRTSAAREKKNCSTPLVSQAKAYLSFLAIHRNTT